MAVDPFEGHDRFVRLGKLTSNFRNDPANVHSRSLHAPAIPTKYFSPDTLSGRVCIGFPLGSLRFSFSGAGDFRHPAAPEHLRVMERHHITDSDLERYYLGTFQGLELAMLEEHLFWCIPCGARLTRIEARDVGHFAEPTPGACSHA
jgi:hypothetical protein